MNTNNKLKIFLSYHKKTPCFKSEAFQPIFVGADLNKESVDFAISDNTGENISDLNLYYCELTGHYWVLKNYLDSCAESYIGFAHYRRLPDISNISDKDYPSIFGCTYSEALKIFEKLNKADLYENCKNYDIILPCSVYLYADTVNPMLRNNEKHYNMYDQFKKEHKNNLIDVVGDIIKSDYPDYYEGFERTCKKEKIHCFNMYIIKKDILKSFLEWEFDLLNKTGVAIGGWKQEKYSRMAGFLGERLINIWLEKNNRFKIGYFPTYMIDFEADYIIKANQLHSEKKYAEEIKVLKEYSQTASDKFKVYSTIIRLYELTNQTDSVPNTLNSAEQFAKKAEDYYFLAQMNEKYGKHDPKVFFKKAIESEPDEKFYAQGYLVYAKATKDISTTNDAWNYMLKFDLTPREQEEYKHFKKIQEMLNN